MIEKTKKISIFPKLQSIIINYSGIRIDTDMRFLQKFRNVIRWGELIDGASLKKEMSSGKYLGGGGRGEGAPGTTRSPRCKQI